MKRIALALEASGLLFVSAGASAASWALGAVVFGAGLIGFGLAAERAD